MARAQRFDIFTSSHLLTELAAALAHPKLARRLNAAQADPQQLIQDYIALAQVIQNPPPIHPRCRDPDDDHVLACAQAAQADLIVSGDKDLLVLQSYYAIRVFDPSTALAYIVGLSP